MRRVVVIAGVAAVAAVALLVVLYALSPILYGVYPPKPNYGAPRSEAEAQRDDLDYLRHFTTLDWSYTPETRATANAIIDRALKVPLPLSRGDFLLVVARVAATADNGHSNIWGSTSANFCNRLPLRFYVFADGIFVVRALPEAREALGGELIQIDGVPIEAVRKMLRPMTGGTEGEKNARLPFFLESPDVLHAAGITKDADKASLTLRLQNGQLVDLTLEALPPNAKAAKIWPSDELAPVPLPGEGARWMAALKGKVERLPLFTGAPRAFYFTKLKEPDAFYVRFSTNDDADGTSIVDFAERARQAALSARPQSIIIDLRMNGGGDYTKTADFMLSLPRSVPQARIFVLLSQETFSAGMSDAAFLKQSGEGRVRFVGDWPGDRIRFHSEGGPFCLPYSHLCMTARTAIHDYSTASCVPYFECYFIDRFYPAAISSFAPDVAAPLTYEALSHGRDPALEAIEKRVAMR